MINKEEVIKYLDKDGEALYPLIVIFSEDMEIIVDSIRDFSPRIEDVIFISRPLYTYVFSANH